MSTEPEPGVIGSLPRTRPHRRSDKRAASPAGAPPVDSQSEAEPKLVNAAKPKRTATTAKTARTPAKPRTTPSKSRTTPAKPRPTSPSPAAATTTAAGPRTPTAQTPPDRAPADASHGALETAVQAAAELAEIGLHASARALRRAVSRLPRP